MTCLKTCSAASHDALCKNGPLPEAQKKQEYRPGSNHGIAQAPGLTDKTVASVGACIKCSYDWGCSSHDCVGRLVDQNKGLTKQVDILIRELQLTRTRNRELNQELEAQLRSKMGDKIMDESLAILRGERTRSSPEFNVHDCDCACTEEDQ